MHRIEGAAVRGFPFVALGDDIGEGNGAVRLQPRVGFTCERASGRATVVHAKLMELAAIELRGDHRSHASVRCAGLSANSSLHTATINRPLGLLGSNVRVSGRVAYPNDGA